MGIESIGMSNTSFSLHIFTRMFSYFVRGRTVALTERFISNELFTRPLFNLAITCHQNRENIKTKSISNASLNHFLVRRNFKYSPSNNSYCFWYQEQRFLASHRIMRKCSKLIGQNLIKWQRTNFSWVSKKKKKQTDTTRH